MAAAYKKSRFGVTEYFSTILREHAESLLLAIALALLVRWLVLSAFVVRSDAMAPTLLEGEVVLGFRPPFGLELPFVGQLSQGRLPRPGELVVSKCPTGLCLLRVVGVPGDRLEMQRQRLVRNQTICQYTAKPGHPQELAES
ncbi:MAG: signal peptidase I, partial [Bdellovibrionales bacterium]